MRTYVVTGAAGFIGSHLSRMLVGRGDRVVGVDNFDPFYDRRVKEANVADLVDGGERFSLVEADICDGDAMAAVMADTRPDVIFHIAALAGVRPSVLDPRRYMAVNVDGLVNVLEVAREHGCRRMVFASSSSVYGNASRVPFAEDDPADTPISPYAATKRAGELICRTWCDLHGFSIAALRFFTVFGPGQRPDLAINRFMRLIADGGEVPMFGDGSMSRDYTYIDDITGGVLAAAERVADAPAGDSRVYNLGGNSPVRLDAMIREIGAVVGRTPLVKPYPVPPGDVDRTWADLTRSGAELGYAPSTSFHEGLERQWAWMTKSEEVADTPRV